MFNTKIDKFDEYDNEIHSIDKQELDLLKQLSDMRKKKEIVQLKRRDYGICYYSDKIKRKNILIQAQEYGYSLEKIEELKPYIENWNQDIIDNDKIDSLRFMESFVNDNLNFINDDQGKNCLSKWLYKIGKVCRDEGGNTNNED